MVTYSKEYYAQKQREYRQRHTEYVKRWKLTSVKQRIRDILGNRCMVCGWSGEGLSIHHPKQDKKNRRDYKITKAKEYVLLCPNHHKELHSNMIHIR